MRRAGPLSRLRCDIDELQHDRVRQVGSVHNPVLIEIRQGTDIPSCRTGLPNDRNDISRTEPAVAIAVARYAFNDGGCRRHCRGFSR